MLALTNGRLIDGTGRDPIEKVTIIIDGNRVKSIDQVSNYPDNTDVINLHGLTVMPGLIDCHLHLGGLTVDQSGKVISKVSFTDMASFFWDYFRNYAHRRHLAIENGVTTIRSAGDHYPHIIKLRDKIAAGKLVGPRIFTPGPTITAPGGHPAGTIYKGNRYIIENATRQIADVNSAREEVKKLIEGGVDCIKAIFSDINPMDITHRVPKLSLDILEVLADEAHQHNLRLMVHTGSPKETMDAVKAGADSIEHGLLPGAESTEFEDDLVKIMLDKGTFFVPTLAIAWAYKETYPAVFSGLKTTVNKLHSAGVKIAAGTDSGTPGVVIGKGLHKELELMVEAGISPMEAIMAGTRNAAANLGKLSELGTIEPGKLADIIAVSGDPLKDIRDTREIKLVIKDGKTVLVDEFDKIDPVDLSYCLKLLSNGRCDVHSARMHETIESHFTILAFANPEGDIFSGNPQMDIGLRPTVMSRFALVVRVEAIERSDMLSLFSRSLDAKGELKHLPQYFDQWLKLARAYNPELKVSSESRERYLLAMVDIVEKYINTPLRRDIRIKDYLRRVPEAIARAEFEPV